MDWDSDSELYDYFKTLIAIRKRYQTLRTGDFRIVQAEKDSQVFAYERYGTDCVIRAIINMSDNVIDVNDHDVCGNVLFQHGYENGKLTGKGFVMIKR